MNDDVDRDLFPGEMRDYFDLKWPENLWDLGEEAVEAPIDAFLWQLHCPFWKTRKGVRFNLAPVDVLKERQRYEGHYQRILESDTRYPAMVARFGSLEVILDGIHRLAKLHLQGSDTILIRHVSKSDLLPMNVSM